MDTQLAKINQENELIKQELLQKNIMYDQIAIEPRFLTPQEILEQTESINTYLKRIISPPTK